MNIYFSPMIPNWNFDYSTLNENAIEEEEKKLQEKIKEITSVKKNIKLPGYDSSDNEDITEEDDDGLDDDDAIDGNDWEMAYEDDFNDFDEIIDDDA